MRAAAIGSTAVLALGALLGCSRATSAPPAVSPTTPPRASSTAPGSPSASVGARPSSSASPTPTAPLVAIVDRLIPYGAQRRDQMADYALRHYGVHTSSLTPRRIVVHLTASDSAAGAIELFASNAPHLGDLPGTCAHYLVDQDGTVLRLVPDSVMCRHVIGLNDQAIGVEVVQGMQAGSVAAAHAVLERRAQRDALVGLLRTLMRRHGLSADQVIGHAMANEDPLFHDLLGWRNDHTDWGSGEIAKLRSLL